MQGRDSLLSSQTSASAAPDRRERAAPQLAETMADKETIINAAIRNMRAGKLNQAHKLTMRREVKNTAIAKVRAAALPSQQHLQSH